MTTPPTSTSPAVPSYRDLPIDPSKPPRSAWGVFGDDDQVGTINLLTPERVQRGAALVRKGAVFSLNWDVEMPSPPVLGRRPLKHTYIDLNPGTDDYYDNFYPQGSSQWDSLCHMAHPGYGFYNGRTKKDFTGKLGSRNGIDNWSLRGIAGRFVLADVGRWREAQGRPVDNSEKDVISVDEVDATLAYQEVELEPGDILLIRLGWIGWYESQSQVTRDTLGAMPVPGMKAPGLSVDPRTDEWLWDRHVAAVASDVPALEALPYEATVEQFLHWRVIPLLGLAVGEMFVLDPLAADCAADRTYEGLLTAAPMNKVGGAGSPANALALK
jgi:kynurenine formamidase